LTGKKQRKNFFCASEVRPPTNCKILLVIFGDLWYILIKNGEFTMQVQVQKLEQGLALPIPQSLIEATDIKDGTFIESSFNDGKLIAMPVVEQKYSLAELLAGVTQENLHGEIDWGNAIGKEVW
jgi:antitoxin MazE